MNRRSHPVISPDEILYEEFLLPRGISMNALACSLAMPPNRITEIVAGRRGIRANTTLRLAKFFGTSAELWMDLQADHDLRVARRERGAMIAGPRGAAIDASGATFE